MANDGNASAAARQLAEESRGCRRKTTGSPRSSSAARRLNGEPTEQTAQVAGVRARARRALIALPIALQDERLTSHEADELLAQRERDWRRRKRQVDAMAAALILRTISTAARAREDDLRSLSLVVVRCRRAAGGAWFYTRCRPAVQGIRRGGAVRRDSAGRRDRRDRATSGGRRRRPRRQRFRLALWLTGAGRRLQAGEYRFDRPDVAARRWPTRSRAATSTSSPSRSPKG